MIQRRVFLAASALACAACQLPEITVPPGDTIVIVQGVMRPDRNQQWILVERSFDGTALAGGLTVGPIPFPGTSETPVSNATVVVTNRTVRAVPCRNATFTESGAPGDQRRPGVYWAPAGCPTMAGGDTLDLRVTTAEGVATSTTVLPIVEDMTLATADTALALPGDALRFNRDNDTLVAAVTALTGRALQLSILPIQFSDVPLERLAELTTHLWADSTVMKVPGDFVNVFESDFDPDVETPDLFDAGTSYQVHVAFTDRQYFDAIRSGNSPLSGRGFVNSIEGGFGYFGSVIAASSTVKAVGTLDDPREGRYRVTGVVSATPIAIELEAYVGRPLPEDTTALRVRGFLNGQWVFGPIDNTVVGVVRGSRVDFVVLQATGQRGRDGSPLFQQWRVFGDLPSSGEGSLEVLQGGERTSVRVVREAG